MFEFRFLQEIGTDISWDCFAAQCWNLALIYFGFEVIKWFDAKLEKIFRRMGKDEEL